MWMNPNQGLKPHGMAHTVTYFAKWKDYYHFCHEIVKITLDLHLTHEIRSATTLWQFPYRHLFFSTSSLDALEKWVSDIIKDSSRWSLSVVGGPAWARHDGPVSSSLLKWSWPSVTGLVQTTREVTVCRCCLHTATATTTTTAVVNGFRLM